MKTSRECGLSPAERDCTAMLLMLLERGEPVADVVFFDTGWEFPRNE